MIIVLFVLIPQIIQKFLFLFVLLFIFYLRKKDW